MGYTIPDVLVDGEVIESDPPRKLVQTWRSLMDPATAAEGFTRLTYEISPGGKGVSQRAFPNPSVRRKPRSYVEQSTGRASENASWGRP